MARLRPAARPRHRWPPTRSGRCRTRCCNTLIDEGNPWGARSYFKAAFMTELTDAAIADFVVRGHRARHR